MNIKSAMDVNDSHETLNFCSTLRNKFLELGEIKRLSILFLLQQHKWISEDINCNFSPAQFD